MTRHQIYEILKKEKLLTLDELSHTLGKSRDYIKGLVDSDNEIIYTGVIMGSGKNGKGSLVDVVTLNGFGTDRCIVCGENNIFEYDAMRMKIPEKILSLKGLALKRPDHKEEGILGHKKCYNLIDVFFRHNDGLHCWDCSSWHGEWIDGDEVLEKCSEWNYEASGHKGVIGADSACNFFYPDHDMKTKADYEKERELFNKSNFSIALRTKKGFENLIGLLEKARLIEQVA